MKTKNILLDYEALIEELQEGDKMEQKDLKNLMVVELRDGRRYVVIENYLINDDGFLELKDYKNFKENKYKNNNYDIIKVYQYKEKYLPLGKGLQYYINNISKEVHLIWEKKQEQKIGDLTCKELYCNNCPLKYFNCANGGLDTTLFETFNTLFKDDKENPIYKIVLKQLNKENLNEI